MLRRFLWAGALSSLGMVALAHNGATGVVMDRMMGMTAIKDIMASLAPMMRGEAPFDVRAAQEGAARIIAHAGDNMNRLFPEGSLQAASYAKPEIWSEWEDFATLSGQLEAYALGLAMAAPNGLTAPTSAVAAPDTEAMDHSTMQMEAAKAPAPSSGGMIDHSTMPMGTPARDTAQEAPVTTYTVSQLMGMERPGASVQTASAASTAEAIDFALLAADEAFEMVSQTCSSCHARFRSGN